MISRILVPLDGSPLAECALPYAVRLTLATRARLLLVHAKVLFDGDKLIDVDVYGLAQALREGRQIGKLTIPRPIAVSALVQEAYPDKVADEICATIDNQRADLVVMSTHGHSGLGRWLDGGVADQVIRQSRAPVLLISTMCDYAWPVIGPFRILVPLDGSELAEAVLGPVGDLAVALQADLILVGATGPLDYSYADDVPFGRPGLERALEEVQVYLNAVAERLRDSGQSVTTVAEMGRAGPVIDAVARERNVDLIAMATHGRGGLARIALGSVATETLQRAKVPLLLTGPNAMEILEPQHGQTTQPKADLWPQVS